MLAAEVVLGMAGLILALAIVFVAFELFADDEAWKKYRVVYNHQGERFDGSMITISDHVIIKVGDLIIVPEPKPLDGSVQIFGDYPITPLTRDLMTSIDQARQADHLHRFAACWPIVKNPKAVVKTTGI